MKETDLNILKYKLVLRPIMFSIVGFFVFYSLFHWVCLTYFYDFEFAEEYLNRKFYFILIGLLNLIVIIPRLSLIFKSIKYKESDYHIEETEIHHKNWALKIITLLLLNIGFFSFFMFSQDYINSIFSQITHLDKFSNINSKPPTKYYKSKNYFIDIEKGVYFSYKDTVKVSGGYRNYRNSYIKVEDIRAVIYPMYNYESQSKNNDNDNVLGWVYSEEPLLFSNTIFYLNINENNKYKDYYFIRLPGSSYYFEKLDNLIKVNTDIDHKNLLFEFKNEKFEERSKNQSLDLLYIILIILPLILIFSNDVVFYTEKIDRLQNGESIYYICLPDFIHKQFKK